MDARSMVLSNGFTFKELIKLKSNYMKFKNEFGDEKNFTFFDSIIYVSKVSVKSISALFIMSLLYILATLVFDFIQTLFAVPFLTLFLMAEVYKNAKAEKHSILTEVKLIKLGLRIKLNQLS